MACYIRIRSNDDSEEIIEVPTENDSMLLLSTVSAQFPNTVGLRFKTESGAWRGLQVEGNIIKPPPEGWGNSEYYVVTKKVLKRRVEDDDSPVTKLSRMADEESRSKLIVQGLPHSTTVDEFRKHFETFGTMDLCDIKYYSNGKCRGYAFIKYRTVESVEAAFDGIHVIGKRRCSLEYAKKHQRPQVQADDNIPTKLFIGHLPVGTKTEDLQEYFCKYGVLKNVYIPEPFREFGFVLFASRSIADKVLNEQHVLKGNFLNVTLATERRTDEGRGPPPGFGNMHYGMQNMWSMGNMQDGMRNMGSMQAGLQNMGNMQANLRNMGNMQAGMQNMGNMQAGMQNMGNIQAGMQNMGNMQAGMQNMGNIQAGMRNMGNTQDGLRNLQNLLNNNPNLCSWLLENLPILKSLPGQGKL